MPNAIFLNLRRFKDNQAKENFVGLTQGCQQLRLVKKRPLLTKLYQLITILTESFAGRHALGFMYPTYTSIYSTKEYDQFTTTFPWEHPIGKWNLFHFLGNYSLLNNL